MTEAGEQKLETIRQWIKSHTGARLLTVRIPVRDYLGRYGFRGHSIHIPVTRLGPSYECVVLPTAERI